MPLNTTPRRRRLSETTVSSDGVGGDDSDRRTDQVEDVVVDTPVASVVVSY